MIAFSFLLVFIGIGVFTWAEADWKDSKGWQKRSHKILRQRAILLYTTSAVCLFTSLGLIIKTIIDAQG